MSFDNTSSGDRPLVSRFAAELVASLITAALGLAVVIGALDYQIGWDDAGPQPGYFPFYVGLVIVAGSIGVAAQALVLHRHSAEVFITAERAKRAIAFFGPIVVFVGVSLVIGLYLATALYLILSMTIQGRYKVLPSIATGVGVSVGFFILFETIFKQPLLKGPLEAWLGFH